MEKKRKAVKSPPKKYTKAASVSDEKLTFTGKVKKSLRGAKIEKLCCKTAYAAGLAAKRQRSFLRYWPKTGSKPEFRHAAHRTSSILRTVK